MKFSNLGRNVLVTGVSAAMAFGLFACSRDYTPAYVYTTSAQNGTISAFAIDYETGIPTQIAGSPFTTQLSNPISAIASPNNQNLYEIGGSQNAQVESFGIGSDGKLYGSQTVNTTGTYPTGAAIDSTGSFLFVTYQYQIGAGPNKPGPGGLSVFPIQSNGSLGTPVDVPLDVDPIGVAVTPPITTAGNVVYVYVIEQPTANAGLLRAFSLNTASGALTAVDGGTGIQVGVNPSAIVSEPTARFVYVADKTSNEIYGYQINADIGTLRALPSNPTATGQYPVGMAVDPRGEYLYAVNYNSSTVSSFTINHGTGALGGIATSLATATGPTCITIDPALGIYVFTSNYLDGSMTGAQLKPEDGTLTQIANSPFPTNPLPSCITSVANGSHSQSFVNPN